MKIPLSHTGQFSKLFLNYVESHDSLTPFCSRPAKIDSFENVIANKQFLHREILCRAIEKQYQKSGLTINTSKLSHNQTFTVTTGHQLNIFTGPLYFIYKILTTVKLAKQLKLSYPDCDFIPIYWMASEDHDFQEINHAYVFGKKVVWTPEKNGGAVGRLLTDGFGEIWEQVPDLEPIFSKYYNGRLNLAQATRALVHDLFSDFGLMVVDGDDPSLKALFVSIMEREVQEQFSFKALQQTNTELSDLGYHTQVMARPINLFYLGEYSREKIVNQGDEFISAHRKWSVSELIDEIRNSPQNFSPNVVLRPLYQEIILPNLAYIGGPAEVAYWLQLKGVFQEAQVEYPIVMPRNFAMIFPKNSVQKIEKLGFKKQDLLKAETELKEIYLDLHSNLTFEIEEEKNELKRIFSEIMTKIRSIDPTLEAAAAAEEQRLQKGLEALEKRVQKSIEARHSVALTQIANLKQKFFPESNPQERHDNFINFWFNDRNLINLVYQHLDPFDFSYFLLEI